MCRVLYCRLLFLYTVVRKVALLRSSGTCGLLHMLMLCACNFHYCHATSRHATLCYAMLCSSCASTNKQQEAKPDMQAASKLLTRKVSRRPQHPRQYGHVPGVAVGAAFRGRGELDVLGLHTQMMAGINSRWGLGCAVFVCTTMLSGVKLATRLCFGSIGYWGVNSVVANHLAAMSDP